MWYKIVIMAIMIGASGSIKAQTDTSAISKQVPDTVAKVKRWKVLVGFDTKRSFFAGRPVIINGLRLGAKFKEVHRFGISFYALQRGVVFRDLEVDEEDATDTSYVQFNAGFASVFYEYAFFRTKRWELAVPSYLGSGNVTASYTDTAGIYRQMSTTPFMAIGTGIAAQFKIIRWFGLKAGLGYRQIFNDEKATRTAFSGPYYKFGVTVFLGDLYNSIFRRERLKPW